MVSGGQGEIAGANRKLIVTLEVAALFQGAGAASSTPALTARLRDGGSGDFDRRGHNPDGLQQTAGDQHDRTAELPGQVYRSWLSHAWRIRKVHAFIRITRLTR